MKRFFTFVLYSVSCVLVSFPQAFACSVCFDNPDSLQSKALGVSVFFLLGTVGSVLGGILYTIISCVRRAKKISPLEAPAVNP